MGIPSNQHETAVSPVVGSGVGDITGARCWSCGAEAIGAHFCAACGHIQPLPPAVDYFTFFELPHRLGLDAAELEKQFLRLSWKLHPDNFVGASDYERQLSLDRASQLNDAYRTLQAPLSRVEYLLGLEGVRREGAAKQQAPPELLEEVFELNESLDELRSARSGSANGAETSDLRERLVAAQEKFQERLGEIDTELHGVLGDWDALLEHGSGNGSTLGVTQRAELLARMNEILNRRSYVRNLVNTVQAELEQQV